MLEGDLEAATFARSYRRSDRRQYWAGFPQGDLIQIICSDGVVLRTFTGDAGQIVPLLP